MPIPEPNGAPKLTPRDGCGPGIKKKKKKWGGKKTNLPYSFKIKFLYEIIHYVYSISVKI